MPDEVSAAQAIETTIAAAGGKVMYTGSGVALGGWAVSSEMVGLIGVLIAAIGLGVNWYYKHKLTTVEIKLKIEQAAREMEAHSAHMEQSK
jgi:hypothetical protein